MTNRLNQNFIKFWILNAIIAFISSLYLNFIQLNLMNSFLYLFRVRIIVQNTLIVENDWLIFVIISSNLLILFGIFNNLTHKVNMIT